VDVYSSCLLQSYGILPTAPLDLQVSNVNPNYAILQWAPPEVFPDMEHEFNLHFHELAENPREALENPFRSVADVQSPHVISGLKPDTRYEAYVQAANSHGVGEPSQRIVFRTPTQHIEDLLEKVSAFCFMEL
jgi:hypothetical protein